MSCSFNSKTLKRRPTYQSMSWTPPQNVSNLSNSNSDNESDSEELSTPKFRRRRTSAQREASTQIENNILFKQSTPRRSWIYLTFLVLIFSIVSIFYIAASNNLIDIDDLKQMFPYMPNETFENFEAVIDDILATKEIHPAVFLFLYKSNERIVNDLIDHLAKYASSKLQTKTDYIDVPKNEFYCNEALTDYGYLLDKYKSDLLNKKVMVVKNLQNIPGQVAQVFHSFCDEISPLVEKVVYIFTLKVNSMVGKEEKIAESNLKRLWKELDNDILMPLITRVTSTVLKISN